MLEGESEREKETRVARLKEEKDEKRVEIGDTSREMRTSGDQRDIERDAHELRPRRHIARDAGGVEQRKSRDAIYRVKRQRPLSFCKLVNVELCCSFFVYICILNQAINCEKSTTPTSLEIREKRHLAGKRRQRQHRPRRQQVTSRHARNEGHSITLQFSKKTKQQWRMNVLIKTHISPPPPQAAACNILASVPPTFGINFCTGHLRRSRDCNQTH